MLNILAVNLTIFYDELYKYLISLNDIIDFNKIYKLEENYNNNSLIIIYSYYLSRLGLKDVIKTNSDIEKIIPFFDILYKSSGYSYTNLNGVKHETDKGNYPKEKFGFILKLVDLILTLGKIYIFQINDIDIFVNSIKYNSNAVKIKPLGIWNFNNNEINGLNDFFYNHQLFFSSENVLNEVRTNLFSNKMYLYDKEFTTDVLFSYESIYDKNIIELNNNYYLLACQVTKLSNQNYLNTYSNLYNPSSNTNTLLYQLNIIKMIMLDEDSNIKHIAISTLLNIIFFNKIDMSMYIKLNKYDKMIRKKYSNTKNKNYKKIYDFVEKNILLQELLEISLNNYIISELSESEEIDMQSLQVLSNLEINMDKPPYESIEKIYEEVIKRFLILNNLKLTDRIF